MYLRMYSGKNIPRALKNYSNYRVSRSYSKSELSGALYLNPHAWKGLPADRIFELHNLRKDAMGEKYNPDDEERRAILSTFTTLGKVKPTLEYAYEIDNFKERHMNNTPVNLRGLPPMKSNINVVDKGATPHEQRKIEQLHRISAYEMPLLAKFRQEYKPEPTKDSPIKLSFNSDFSDGSNSLNRKVTLLCNIEDLNLNEKQQRKFKILATNRFNHHTNSIKFSSNQYAEATQNARHLVSIFNRLLEASKDLSDDFSDIPVDTRHMHAKKAAPSFPESWKRPEDAPIARHKIIRRLVDEVKQKQDAQYINNYSP